MNVYWNKIQAIKRLRETTTLGLKEAKDAVEAAAEQLKEQFDAAVKSEVERQVRRASLRESVVEAFIQGGNLYSQYGHFDEGTAFSSLEEMFTFLAELAKNGKVTLSVGQWQAGTAWASPKAYKHKLVFRKG